MVDIEYSVLDGWSHKSFNKLFKVLKKKGVEGLDNSGVLIHDPKLRTNFEFWDAIITYDYGVGFIFKYDIPLELDGSYQHIVYERTFYYDKVEDRTYMTNDGYAIQIYSEEGFVNFPPTSTVSDSIREWVRDKMKEYEQKNMEKETVK